MRVVLSLPLKIHGQVESGETFSVIARTHTVSRDGCSLELEENVVLGEILRLENETTREKIDAKVVSIRHARDGKKYLGLQFANLEVNFWHMAFPAPNARPLRRGVTATSQASA
jgi:hypothetical protein